MKIFITGIAGFIGFHLARELKAYGHDVLGCDNYNGMYAPHLKMDRCKVLEMSKIPVKNADIGFLNESIVEDSDIIVHLAAWAGVRLSLDMPNVYTKNNILGTQGVIDIAEKLNIPVVYASSSSVYAGQKPPFTEDMNFKHHLNPYAWSKYVNECQFKHSKLRSSIGFRFFTVYGPYGRPDMALHGFTDKIVRDEPIEVFGHGKMSRDFTYVQDIVNGVQLLIDKVHGTNGHEIYNIGSGESVPLMSFVRLIEENLERKAKINYVDMHAADIRHTLADITEIKTLGYRPMTSIETGIRSFISWYKDYYQKN
jgi:UDP-glucuronate 4-epimerase